MHFSSGMVALRVTAQFILIAAPAMGFISSLHPLLR